jgi:vesicular inhibitory amino acid transporter
LVTIPEYSQSLNRLAVWLIALNPIAKYGLTLNPVLLSWQIELQNNHRFELWFAKAEWRRSFVNSVGIILTSLLIVYLAMLIPNFDSIMSVLGAMFSFFISGIFPIMCHLKLYGSKIGLFERTISIILIIVAGAMAFTGTLFNFI